MKMLYAVGVALLLAVPLAPGAFAATSATANPIDAPRLLGGEVLAYQFDNRDLDTLYVGSVRDISPSASTGTRVGTTSITSGPDGLGQALDTANGFGGAYVHVENAAPLNSITGDFSVLAWIRPATLNGVIFDMQEAGCCNLHDEIYVWLAPNSAGGNVNARLWGRYGDLAFPTSVPINVWTHLAVVGHAGTVSVVVNGVVQSSLSGAYTREFTNRANIGFANTGWSGGGAPAWTGALDEVRIFNRSVTGPEIQSILQLPYFHSNLPPTARMAALAPAECVNGRATVQLDGSASSDPESDPLTFAWSTPGVVLSDAAAPKATGSFPLGSTAVTLQVSDGQYTSTASGVQQVVDTLPPVTSLALSGTPGNAGWFRSAVTATLSPSDACGLKNTYYTLDSGTPQVGTSRRITGETTHTFAYKSDDIAGNVEATHNIDVKIDSTPPTVALLDPVPGHVYVSGLHVAPPQPLPLTLVVGTMTLRADASDPNGVDASGMDRVDYYVDGVLRGSANSAPYLFAWEAGKEKLGAHQLEARAFDVAGNQARSLLDVETIPTTLEGVMATLP